MLSVDHNGLIVEKTVKAKVYESSNGPEGHRSMFSEVLALDFGSKIEHCCQNRPLTVTSFIPKLEHLFKNNSYYKYIKYHDISLFANC